MAEKRIEYKDIAAEDLFKPATDSAKELSAQLDKLEADLKDILKVSVELSKSNPLAGYKDIQEAEKAFSDVKKAVAELNKVELARIRLAETTIKLEIEKTKAAAAAEKQTNANAKATKSLTDAQKAEAKAKEKLAFLDTDAAKAAAEVAAQIKAKTAALKQSVAESSSASTAYQKESARLNRLRNEYKDLAVQNKENTEEAKDLLAAIQKLDKQLKDIDESVGQNQRSVGNYRIAVDRLSGSMKLLANTAVIGLLVQIASLFSQNSEGAGIMSKAIGRITVTLSTLIARAIKALPELQEAFTGLFSGLGDSFDSFVLKIQLKMAQLPEILGGSAKEAEKIQASIDALAKKSAAAASPIEVLGKAFSGVGQEIEDLIGKNDKLIDKTLAYQKQINRLNESVASMRKEQELLQIASDDDTISLEKQAEATVLLIQKTNEIIAAEIKVLQKRKELATLNAQVNKGSIEAQTELSESRVALLEKEAEQAAAIQEGNARLRQIERDNMELDLDQLIDIADKRKTVNEQIAGDERNSIAARVAAIQEASIDIEAAFRKQAEVLGVSASIDDLLSETDTVKLNARIKSLGLDEIRQNRLREVIQERAQATQDLATAQSDLQEVSRKAAETNSDIILQEEALLELSKDSAKASKVLADLEARRLENDIANLRIRIGIAQEGSTEILELNKSLNDKLLEQNQARAEKEKTQRAKQQEAVKLSLQLIGNLIEKASEKRLAAIDKEISASEKRQDVLRELAAKGAEDADQNLATEQKKQAELEQSRAKAIRNQKRLELGLAAIETYNTKKAAGEPNALASTIAEIAALQLFVESLPGFFTGTENIEKSLGLPDVAGKDGYIVRVDGSERVMSGAQNAMIGPMQNNELAALALAHRTGSLAASESGGGGVERELKVLQKIVADKPAYLGRDYDATQKAIIDIVEKQGRIERTRRKPGLL
jgi:DNA repair exonuclease SbcCD ATPase subunit